MLFKHKLMKFLTYYLLKGSTMKQSTRAKVAAVIAAVMKGQKVSTVYDCSIGSYRNISSEVSEGRVTGYDYSTSSHFSSTSAGKLDFYDYETSTQVRLKVEGSDFLGYDCHSSQNFSGTIDGNTISLYEHETSQSYSYRV